MKDDSTLLIVLVAAAAAVYFFFFRQGSASAAESGVSGGGGQAGVVPQGLAQQSDAFVPPVLQAALDGLSGGIPTEKGKLGEEPIDKTRPPKPDDLNYRPAPGPLSPDKVPYTETKPFAPGTSSTQATQSYEPVSPADRPMLPIDRPKPVAPTTGEGITKPPADWTYIPPEKTGGWGGYVPPSKSVPPPPAPGAVAGPYIPPPAPGAIAGTSIPSPTRPPTPNWGPQWEGKPKPLTLAEQKALRDAAPKPTQTTVPFFVPKGFPTTTPPSKPAPVAPTKPSAPKPFFVPKGFAN